MTQKRLLFFLLTLLFLGVGTYILVYFARGYSFSFSQRNFQPQGLLAVTSVPDGAQILVEGELKDATNTTLFLTPGEYELEVKKEGFTAWKKKVKIEKEVVTKVDAWLFPIVPNLQAMTFTGAQAPLLSPNESKIAYLVTNYGTEKNGIWVIGFSDLPFGLFREPKQITRSTPASRDFAKSTYRWSPDSNDLMVTFTTPQEQPASPPKKTKTKPTTVTYKEENFLLNSGTLTLPLKLVEMAKNPPVATVIKEQWAQEEKLKQEQKLLKLPPELVEILKTKVGETIFSPEETKILYRATDSASIPEKLIPPIPGRSTQPEEREIKPNQIYVYDIKEDRNYLIPNADKCSFGQDMNLTEIKAGKFPECVIRWFPNGRHLLFVEKDKISSIEHEGTNKIVIYTGPFQYPFVYPHPGGGSLIILTNLSNIPDSPFNLYTVSLH